MNRHKFTMRKPARQRIRIAKAFFCVVPNGMNTDSNFKQRISYGRDSSPLFFTARGRRYSHFHPRLTPREWSAEKTRRFARPPERLAQPPGTLARRPFSVCATEKRLSALHWRLRVPAFAEDTGPGSALPGTRLLRPVPVQRAPRGGVVLPPGRFPGLPSAGLRTPPAGAAPCSIFEASREDALGRARRCGYKTIIGSLSSANNRPALRAAFWRPPSMGADLTA